jgi:Mce-associated membrane protein
MTDADEPTTPADGREPDAEATAADGPTRRPSAGAQAASRARRIGGRPSPGPRPTPRPAPRPAGDSAGDPAPDDEATEPAPPRRKRSARSRGPADSAPAAASGTGTVTLTKRRRPATRDVAADGAGGRSDADSERLRRQIERLRWIPALVAGAVVVVLLVLCVWQSHGVWWGKSHSDDRTKLRQQVLAAAKPCVAAIVSYDYRKLPASERAGQACITGAFKTAYTKAMESTVKTLAPQSKTVQVFQVAKAGVERVSADGKQWVVLLYGQQQVTNSTTAKDRPRLDILNVEATLNKVGSKWLVSSIH